jgi:hypothetical protein
MLLHRFFQLLAGDELDIAINRQDQVRAVLRCTYSLSLTMTAVLLAAFLRLQGAILAEQLFIKELFQAIAPFIFPVTN